MKILQILPLFLLSLTIVSTNFAQSSDVDEVRALMESELETLRNYLNDDTLKADSKRAEAERQLHRRLSLKEMATQSLGNQVSSIDAKEFDNLSANFERHLVLCYLERIATLKGKRIEITDTRAGEDGSSIIVETQGEKKSGFFGFSRNSNGKSSVEYHLNKIENEWLITKIVIDGIDINQNFRSQFDSTLRRNKPTEIIAKLLKSNKKREKKNPFI